MESAGAAGATAVPERSPIHNRIVGSGLLGRLGLNERDVLTVVMPRQRATPSTASAVESSVAANIALPQTRVVVLGQWTRRPGDAVARGPSEEAVVQGSFKEDSAKSSTNKSSFQSAGSLCLPPENGIEVDQCLNHTIGSQRPHPDNGLQSNRAISHDDSRADTNEQVSFESNLSELGEPADGFYTARTEHIQAKESLTHPTLPDSLQTDCSSATALAEKACARLGGADISYGSWTSSLVQESEQKWISTEDGCSIGIDELISRMQDLADLVSGELEAMDDETADNSGVPLLTAPVSFVSSGSACSNTGIPNVESFVVSDKLENLVQDLLRAQEGGFDLDEGGSEDEWRLEVARLRSRIAELETENISLREQAAVAQGRSLSTSGTSGSEAGTLIAFHAPYGSAHSSNITPSVSSRDATLSSQFGGPKCYKCRAQLCAHTVSEDGSKNACARCRRRPPLGAKVWRCECGQTVCIRCTLVTSSRSDRAAQSNRNPVIGNESPTTATMPVRVSAPSATIPVRVSSRQSCALLADRCQHCGVRPGLFFGMHGFGIWRERHAQRCIFRRRTL